MNDIGKLDYMKILESYRKKKIVMQVIMMIYIL